MSRTPPGDAEKLDCDVLVAGAGPAGSAAAAAAAAMGADVLLVERRRRIGRPAQCAGLVPAVAGRSIKGIKPDAVLSVVRTARSCFPDACEDTSGSPGLVLDRERFDNALAGEAAAAGARVLSGCRVEPRRSGAAAVTENGGRVNVKARVVIGADGPRSAAGMLIGSINSDFLKTIQVTLEHGHEGDETLFFFDRELEGGYGWLFPAGSLRRLGVGLPARSGIKLRQALEYFREKMSRRGFVSGRVKKITGGLVPAGGPLRCHEGGVILAGDAAGLANPVTGAGVMNALISGELAGEAAARAAGGEGDAALRDYADEIEAIFGRTLRQAVTARKRFMESWNLGDDELSAILRRAWPLSAEYRHAGRQEEEISRS